MPEMFCAVSSPMAEVTEIGLKFLVGLIAKCKCPKCCFPGICSSIMTKEVLFL